MGKRSRVKARSTETPAGEVGPRQPCPCGSGRRYKACHGGSTAPAAFSARPFEGLASECDLIALREFVPAATAKATLAGSDRELLICTLLPGATPALVRDDGAIWLGLQVQHAYGDVSRDLGAVIEKAVDAEPGSVIGLTSAPQEAQRLQDLLVDEPLTIEVHDGFAFWIADLDDPDGSRAEALKQADDSVNPTVRLSGVEAAYWTAIGAREYLRWVMPHDEDLLLDAFARLHVAGKDSLGGSRLLGMFRAHGLLVPVWDVEPGTGAAPLEDAAVAFKTLLDDTLATTEPLTSEERAARNGLANRQITIR